MTDMRKAFKHNSSSLAITSICCCSLSNSTTSSSTLLSCSLVLLKYEIFSISSSSALVPCYCTTLSPHTHTKNFHPGSIFFIIRRLFLLRRLPLLAATTAPGVCLNSCEEIIYGERLFALDSLS